jgi:hypothetical protein
MRKAPHGCRAPATASRARLSGSPGRSAPGWNRIGGDKCTRRCAPGPSSATRPKELHAADARGAPQGTPGRMHGQGARAPALRSHQAQERQVVGRTGARDRPGAPRPRACGWNAPATGARASWRSGIALQRWQTVSSRVNPTSATRADPRFAREPDIRHTGRPSSHAWTGPLPHWQTMTSRVNPTPATLADPRFTCEPDPCHAGRP